MGFRAENGWSRFEPVTELSAFIYTTMKVIYSSFVWTALLVGLILSLQNCKKSGPDPTPTGGTTPPATATIPLFPTTVLTTAGITSSSATVSAVINANGGAAISQHGFVYSKTNQTPTLADSKTELGPTTGPFPITINSPLTSLDANSTYYVRAYATNAIGTGYGVVGQVKTSPPVAVALFDNSAGVKVENLAVTTATVTGYIKEQGGAPVTQHGFVYAKSSVTGEPTIDKHSKIELGPVSGAYPYSMKSDLKDLEKNSQYTIRVFATNAGGTAYGPARSFQTSDFIATSTVQGTVFVGSGNNKFYAVDAATGQKKWEFDGGLNNRMDIGASIASNVVVASSYQNKVFGVDVTTGAKQWEYNAGQIFPPIPVVSPAGDLAYIGASGKTVAVDIKTGVLRWENPLVASSYSVVGTNELYGVAGRQLFLLNSTSGARQWSITKASGNFTGNPAIAGGLIFVSSEDGKLYAYRTANGEKAWEFQVDAASQSLATCPTVVNGVVYVAGTLKKIFALDAATGQKKWEYTNPSTASIATFRNRYPVVSDGVVYIGDGGSRLSALNAATGTLNWSLQDSKFLPSRSGVVVGTVLFHAGDNYLTAFDLVNRRVLWTFATTNTTAAPVVLDNNGKIYFATDNGMQQ
jgi:outer membrane protein assembly factor BamB